MDVERAEPALAFFLMLKLHREVWSEKMKPIGLNETFFGFEFTEYVISRALEGDREVERWLNKDPVVVMAEALRKAINQCREKMGVEIGKWRWGSIHVYALES